MVLNPAGSPVNPGNPNNISDSSSGANPQALLDAYKTGNALPPGQTSTNASDPNATLMFGSNNTSLPVKPNTAATTYPVVTSHAATNDVNNMQSTANTLSGQVAGQQVSIAQNKAATAANTQGGQTDTSGTQQGATDQNTSPTGATNDNSDLTNALGSATKALNTANGVSETPAEKQTGITFASIQDQLNQATTTFNNAVGQLQSGSFPLNPTQKAELQTTSQAVQNLVNATQVANQNYINGVRSYGVTTGLSEYSPMLTLASINQATQDTNAKVAQVELDGAKELATLQNSFQTQDYTEMKDSYDALNAALDKKNTMLNDLNTQIQKQITDYNNQQDKLQTNARDALNVLLTQLGGTAFNNLTPDQQAQMSQLEQQAGYPAGIVKEGMNTVAQQKALATQAQAAQNEKDRQTELAITNGFKETALALAQERVNNAGGNGNLTTNQQSIISGSETKLDSNPIVKNFEQIANQYPVVQGIKNGTTDPAQQQELMLAIAQMYDPGSKTVRGVISALKPEDMNSGVYNLLNSADKLFTAKGVLSPAMVNELKGQALQIYNQNAKQYQNIRNQEVNILQARGIPSADQYLSNMSAIGTTPSSQPSQNAPIVKPTGNPPTGEIWVQDKTSGQYGSIPLKEYNSSKYNKLQ